MHSSGGGGGVVGGAGICVVQVNTEHAEPGGGVNGNKYRQLKAINCHPHGFWNELAAVLPAPANGSMRPPTNFNGVIQLTTMMMLMGAWFFRFWKLDHHQH